MKEKSIWELKHELAPHISKDIKNMIVKKGLPASYHGGSCGTSKEGEDSIYVNLDITYNKRIIRIYICFRGNENKLFNIEYFNMLDYQAGIVSAQYKNRPLDLARLRIMRATYEAIQTVLNNNIDIPRGVKSIDFDVDEETGEITYEIINN